MNKFKFVLATLIAAVAFTTSGVSVTQASIYNFCPGTAGLSGWWGSISPSTRHCTNDYYTWNTNSGLSNEESWFKTDPHYLACQYSSTNDPGNIPAKVYIPSPDSQQTNNGAHYYRWYNSSNYVMIGSVNQYSVFGTAWLNTVDWSQFDMLKLTDYTNDTGYHAKHVDLDEVSFDCYFK
jgi:hypothetical protein